MRVCRLPRFGNVGEVRPASGRRVWRREAVWTVNETGICQLPRRSVVANGSDDKVNQGNCDVTRMRLPVQHRARMEKGVVHWTR